MSRLLTIRPVCLYLIGQSCSLFGDTALWLAMGIWVKSLTGSNTAAGLVIFAFAIPQLFAPLYGLLVDRVRRRPLLVVTNLITGVVVLALLLIHNRQEIWLVYVVMFIYGISTPLIASAQSAFLTTLVPSELLGEANGLLQTVRQGLRLIGPLAGAGLFVWLGAGVVAIIDAVTFAIAVLMLLLIHINEPEPEPTESHWGAEVMAGIRHLWQTTILRQLVLACALALLLAGFGETLIFAIVGAGLHRPPAFVSVLTTVQGVGALLGGLTAARLMQRTTEGGLTGLGFVLFALGALVLVLPNLLIVLAGMLLLGVSLPWVYVGVITLLQRLTPAQLQGRAYSAFEALTGLPQTISIALGAALIAFIAYQVLLVSMSVVLLGASVYLLASVKQWKDRISSSEERLMAKPSGM